MLTVFPVSEVPPASLADKEVDREIQQIRAFFWSIRESFAAIPPAARQQAFARLAQVQRERNRRSGRRAKARFSCEPSS